MAEAPKEEKAEIPGWLVSFGDMMTLILTFFILLCTYATTKHAVVGLAEWMAITYHDQGIRTSLLAPLGVRTPMLGPTDSAWAASAAGPIREPEEVAALVVEAIHEERFLILTDPIAQTWMDRKHTNLDRWLGGMRRLQAKIDAAPD